MFSGRQETFPPAAAATVPVVVLKKRVAPASGLLQPPAVDDSPAPHARAPRVFTLSPPVTAALTEDREAPLDAASPSPEPQEPTAAQARSSRRSARADRIGHDTRARVIRHVKLETSALVPGRPAPAAHEGRLESLDVRHAPATADELDAALEGPASLLRQLAKLDNVFADIRRARDFTLIDEHAERLWQRLSQRADQLARELAEL